MFLLFWLFLGILSSSLCNAGYITGTLSPSSLQDCSDYCVFDSFVGPFSIPNTVTFCVSMSGYSTTAGIVYYSPYISTGGTNSYSHFFFNDAGVHMTFPRMCNYFTNMEGTYTNFELYYGSYDYNYGASMDENDIIVWEIFYT